jgi:hypothetical protein
VPRLAALLQQVFLYVQLQQLDDDLAAEVRAAGCHCGGRLHSARYPRKPRGGPGEIGAGYMWRQSFCCARDGCRRRVTPPSVRFLGRKVYLGPVVVVLSAIGAALSPMRLCRLREMIGVSLRTVKRWTAWWQSDFASSRFWSAAQGRLVPPAPAATTLPGSLLARFDGDEQRQLVSMMRFIAPITTATARNGVAL